MLANPRLVPGLPSTKCIWSKSFGPRSLSGSQHAVPANPIPMANSPTPWAVTQGVAGRSRMAGPLGRLMLCGVCAMASWRA